MPQFTFPTPSDADETLETRLEVTGEVSVADILEEVPVARKRTPAKSSRAKPKASPAKTKPKTAPAGATQEVQLFDILEVVELLPPPPRPTATSLTGAPRRVALEPPMPMPMPSAPALHAPESVVLAPESVVEVRDLLEARERLASRNRLQSYAEPPRRRFGWIAGGLVIAVAAALVAGYVHVRPRFQARRAPVTHVAPPPIAPAVAPIAVAAAAPASLAPASASIAPASIAPASIAPVSLAPARPVSGAAFASIAPASIASAAAKADVPVVDVDSLPHPSTGTIVGTRKHRLFVDGAFVPGTEAVVRCGAHAVKVGSGGRTQTVDVPCGGQISVR